MTNTLGKSLTLFYVNGRPKGMLTAEIFGWTGHVLMSPRAEILRALDRREASHTGIYILLGPSDLDQKIYVGEGVDISLRIKSHLKNKEWWEHAILISTNSDKLNKAHAQYLEAKLIKLGFDVGSAEMENGTNPKHPSLGETDESNMDSFLENILLVLPALGVDAFSIRTRTGNATEPVVENSLQRPRFTIKSTKLGLDAKMVISGDEFIIQSGSIIRGTWIGDPNHNYTKLARTVQGSGALEQVGKHQVFRVDYAFSAVSAAAAIVNGRPSNGRTDWKLEGTNTTFAEWEAEQLSLFETHQMEQSYDDNVEALAQEIELDGH